MTVIIHNGDCLAILPTLPAGLIDAVVTDPPYGLEFMGKEWDGADGFRRSLNEADVGRDNAFGRTSAKGPEYRAGHLFQEWCEAWSRELLRVLKPGGHLIAFGGSRTYHRLACAVEDAGFEIRDQIQWLYGSGFPKSHNIGDGRGTALKPAHEPIVLARKPLTGTVKANVEAHGTGALNIDGCRVEGDPKPYGNMTPSEGWRLHKRRDGEASADRRYTENGSTNGPRGGSPAGRWPANVIHDGSEEVLDAFPDGLTSGTGAVKQGSGTGYQANAYGKESRAAGTPNVEYGDTGSAARFFYTAKADKQDRLGSKHPTVKPIDLMAYLCRLVTPKGGTILDPFAGSGSTGMACLREGFECILIEREPQYIADIENRIAHVAGGDTPLFDFRNEMLSAHDSDEAKT
jgi:DNA modification methylase